MMTPARTVIQADATQWLAANPAADHSSVITSLPDACELPHLSLVAWREWFKAAAAQVMRWVPDDGLAIFYQTDVRRDGVWIDKSYLVLAAAEAVGASLVWHKIVCRKPAGTIAYRRSSYAHLLCLAPTQRPAPRKPGPDVLADGGEVHWPRGMGRASCALACRYLREETTTQLVVDPYCGVGSTLDAANAHGFAALGIELSARRCRAALRLGRGDGGGSGVSL